MAPRKTIAGLLLALSFACDAGHTVRATITLPRDIAADYSPDKRGLLVASFTNADEGNRRVIAVVCGDVTRFEVDFGGDGERKKSTINAWILADADGPCGPVNDDRDDGDRVGDEPEATATVEAADGCGASDAHLELTLARPD